jgi:hypothetical protein
MNYCTDHLMPLRATGQGVIGHVVENDVDPGWGADLAGTAARQTDKNLLFA